MFESIPLANIDLNSYFAECMTGADVLRVLNELVGE